MVKIIVDTVIYTCLVLVFVGFAVFAMLFLRTAISDAKATPLPHTATEVFKLPGQTTDAPEVRRVAPSASD